MTVPQHDDNYFTLCHNYVTNKLCSGLLFIVESFKYHSLKYANAIHRIFLKNEPKFDTQERKFKSCMIILYDL